jgi:hypothetical protein
VSIASYKKKTQSDPLALEDKLSNSFRYVLILPHRYFPVDPFHKTTETHQSHFQVYDEFGPNVSGLGETAAMNGLIYDMAKYDSGELTEDDVIGALTGSCFVVGTNDDHLCTYEILLNVDGTFGSAIATGSLEFKESEGGYLIVESAGDGYSNFNGGILTLTYDSIGAETIISCELALL